MAKVDVYAVPLDLPSIRPFEIDLGEGKVVSLLIKELNSIELAKVEAEIVALWSDLTSDKPSIHLRPHPSGGAVKPTPLAVEVACKVACAQVQPDADRYEWQEILHLLASKQAHDGIRSAFYWATLGEVVDDAFAEPNKKKVKLSVTSQEPSTPQEPSSQGNRTRSRKRGSTP